MRFLSVEPLESRWMLAANNLLTNGSFEANVVAHGSWDVFEDSAVPGWYLIGNSGDGAAAPKFEFQKNGLFGGTAADGRQWLELDADENGPNSRWNESSSDFRAAIQGRSERGSLTIVQTIETTAGETYVLKFAFAARPGTGTQQNVLGVRVVDVSTGSDPYSSNPFEVGSGSASELLSRTLTADGSAGGAPRWQSYEYRFKATGGQTLVSFRDQGINDTYGTLLDHVRVELVPAELQVTTEYDDVLTYSNADLVDISEDGVATYQKAVPFRVTASVSASADSAMVLRIYSFADDPNDSVQISEHHLAPGQSFDQVIELPPGFADRIGLRAALFDDPNGLPFLAEEAQRSFITIELRTGSFAKDLNIQVDDVKKIAVEQAKSGFGGIWDKTFDAPWIALRAAELNAADPTRTVAEFEEQIAGDMGKAKSWFMDELSDATEDAIQRVYNANGEKYWKIRIDESAPQQEAVQEIGASIGESTKKAFDTLLADLADDAAKLLARHVEVKLLSAGALLEHVQKDEVEKNLKDFVRSRDLKDFKPELWKDVVAVEKLGFHFPFDVPGKGKAVDGEWGISTGPFTFGDFERLDKVQLKAHLTLLEPLQYEATRVSTFKLNWDVNYDRDTQKFDHSVNGVFEIRR